jgi:hypothetical protein
MEKKTLTLDDLVKTVEIDLDKNRKCKKCKNKFYIAGDFEVKKGKCEICGKNMRKFCVII